MRTISIFALLFLSLAVACVSAADHHVLFSKQLAEPENIYKTKVIKGLQIVGDLQGPEICKSGDSVYVYGHGSNGEIQGWPYIEIMPLIAKCDNVYLLQCCVKPLQVFTAVKEELKLRTKHIAVKDGVFVDKVGGPGSEARVSKFQRFNAFKTWFQSKVKYYSDHVSNLVLVDGQITTLLSPCDGDTLPKEEVPDYSAVKSDMSPADIVKVSVAMSKVAHATAKKHSGVAKFISLKDVIKHDNPFNDASKPFVINY